MKLGALPRMELQGLARRHGFVYRTGPFVVRLRSTHAPLVDIVADFYGEAQLVPSGELADFHIRMVRPINPRRWWHPQVEFVLDRQRPFQPYPLEQALPLLEWGLNWCIAMRAHAYLMLHSAVLERDGRALILPALPGSGKSTLCAALAHRGWRLLSDEFGLVRPETGLVWPLPKAIPLKNRSIGVIRAFLPEAYLGPVFPKTRKGDVAHVRPPGDSLTRQTEPARPGWVVFPKYREGTGTRLDKSPKSLAFTRLAHNSFNYHLKGEAGFHALVALVRQCDCYSFQYSDLDEAVQVFRELSANPEDASAIMSG